MKKREYLLRLGDTTDNLIENIGAALSSYKKVMKPNVCFVKVEYNVNL